MNRRPGCLTPEELIDAADGVLPPDRAAHVASCVRCRHEASAIADTLAEVGAVDVPEPPPCFWSALNRRVAAAIDGGGWAWLRWDTLIPLAGMTALLVALGSAIVPPAAPPADARATTPPIATAGASRSGPIAADPVADAALDLVADLASTLPDGGADTLGLAPLPDLADVAASELSEAEQQALETLLREAVAGPAS
jgi:hypothetical protein